MDIENELFWDLANLQIALDFKALRSNKLIDASKLKDLTERMLSSVTSCNQWIASLEDKTIDDFDDSEAYQFFNVDRAYLAYIKDIESNHFDKVEKQNYKYFVNQDLARI